MPTTTQLVLAALPLATIAFLMIGRYWSATRAMPVAWVVAVGFLGWELSPQWIAAASIDSAWARRHLAPQTLLLRPGLFLQFR